MVKVDWKLRGKSDTKWPPSSNGIYVSAIRDMVLYLERRKMRWLRMETWDPL